MCEFLGGMRRIGTSMMLVAALIFALHSGAAGVLKFVRSAQAAVSLNQHDNGDPSDHDHEDQCKTGCCGTSCTTAVLSTAPAHVAPGEVSSVLSGLGTLLWSSADAHGIKRPPRPSSMA